jgi:hypothetical protein
MPCVQRHRLTGCKPNADSPQTSNVPDPPPANSSTPLQDLSTRKNKVTRKTKVVRRILSVRDALATAQVSSTGIGIATRTSQELDFHHRITCIYRRTPLGGKVSTPRELNLIMES